MNEITALFLFLSTGSVALFSFIAVASWAGSRQAERKAFYKSEVLKKIAESEGAGAAAALEIMREEKRAWAERFRAGTMLSGLIVVGVGLALLVFLKALVTSEPVYLCGLIPLFIGIALVGYSQFLAPRA
jgi:hypothetical protein